MKFNRIIQIIVVASFVYHYSPAFCGNRDIVLPEIPDKMNMDVAQAMERRVGVRQFDGPPVAMEDISAILWAGFGRVSSGGDKTIHGYDVVSGATAKDRHTIPLAWGKKYLKIYLFLADGAYGYDPDGHKLPFITRQTLISDCGATARNAYGVIMIAADFNKMPASVSGDTKQKVGFFSAGSAAQNMYVAGAALNVQMLTQTSMDKEPIARALKFPDHLVPMVILPFGHVR